MANSNSPWGKGGRGSGSGSNGSGNMGGGGKGPVENPLERALREAQMKMRGALGGAGGRGAGGLGGGFDERRILGMVGAGLLGLWLLSGIYRVNSDELGIVLRFGEYQRTAGPGLNFHVPYPFEQVVIPSVTTVNKVEVGYRAGGPENPNIRVARMSSAGNAADAGAAANREGLMLTGDRNIIDIDFEVQWKIDAGHPQKFLFNMRDPAGNVKAVAESAMREVIGRNTLDDILTSAQSQIAEDTKALMQQMFDDYDAGVEIIAVNLSRPDVPPPVIDEFQDVKRAEQDKQTAESVAEGYRNEIIPRAKGDASKMIQDAEAYKSRVVADAEGNAARFKQIYNEYAVAKEVTKRRMYLETMEDVLKNMPKVILDNAGKGGATPILPLQLLSPKAAGTTQPDTARSVVATPAHP